MGKDFLEKFLGNRTRAQVIRVFVFAQNESLTAAQAAKRAGIGMPAAGKEIKYLEAAGILASSKSVPIKTHSKRRRGKRSKPLQKQDVKWSLDPQFKYARALSSFIHEVSPIRYDNVLNALKNTGRLSVVIASGCLTGDISRPVDLVVVADNLNENRLEHAIRSLEPLFGRELRYSTFGTMEFTYRLTIHDHLLRDILDYPHKVLLDRAGALK